MHGTRPDPAPPGQLRVPLGNLAACQCRWPVEEDWTVAGHFLFCGRPAPFGQVYCQEHRDRGRVIWVAKDA